MENKQSGTKDVKKSKQSKQVKQVEQPQAIPEEQHIAAVEPQAPVDSEQEQKEVRLVDIPIENENVALNVMVGFLNLAHKRGAFGIDESAKIWECILKFQKN